MLLFQNFKILYFTQITSVTFYFYASPEGRTGVSSYTGEGRHLGGIIGIPWPGSDIFTASCTNAGVELELELIQTQMAQKPMLRAEVGMRVRCANKASAE